jgi:hypothetical protein
MACSGPDCFPTRIAAAKGRGTAPTSYEKLVLTGTFTRESAALPSGYSNASAALTCVHVTRADLHIGAIRQNQCQGAVRPLHFNHLVRPHEGRTMHAEQGRARQLLLKRRHGRAQQVAPHIRVQQHIIARRLDPVDDLDRHAPLAVTFRDPETIIIERWRRLAGTQRRHFFRQLSGLLGLLSRFPATAGAIDRLAEAIKADRLQEIIGSIDIEGVGRIMFVRGDEDDLGPRLDIEVRRGPETVLPGIWISRITRSGSSSAIRSSASSPLRAWPTTSTPSISVKKVRSRSRARASSSTINTRMFRAIPPDQCLQLVL